MITRKFRNGPGPYGGIDWDNEADYDGCPMKRWALTDKDTQIRTFMHYTDPEANKDPITVFGAAKKGLFYNYNDRLVGERWSEGWDKARAAGLTPKTARFFEAVLNHFHDSTDVNLQHVLLGVNRSNGYDYLVFGYTYTSRSGQ